MQTCSFDVGHKARRKPEGKLRPTRTNVDVAIRPDQPMLCVGVYGDVLCAMYFSAAKSANATRTRTLEKPLDAAFAKSLTHDRLEEMITSAVQDSQGDAAICMTMLETILDKEEDLFKRRSAGSLKAAQTRKQKATQGPGSENAVTTSGEQQPSNGEPGAGDGKVEESVGATQPSETSG